MKILEKNFLDISQKIFGSAYGQSPRKCSNIEILAKIEGKEVKFFSRIYEGHRRIWFRSNENSKLSHACVPLSSPAKNSPQCVQNRIEPGHWKKKTNLSQYILKIHFKNMYLWGCLAGMNFSHKLKLSQHCKVLDIWVRGGGRDSGLQFYSFWISKGKDSNGKWKLLTKQ